MRENSGQTPVWVCPKCGLPAMVTNFVEIPQRVNGAGRITFDANGNPEVRKVPTVSGHCRGEHSHAFFGPVADYEEAAVAAFMAAVEEWSRGPALSA